MSIEIKELVVKTTVDNEMNAGNDMDGGEPAEALEKLKAQIISECKDMLSEMLNEMRDR